jgi:hypothetical protein
MIQQGEPVKHAKWKKPNTKATNCIPFWQNSQTIETGILVASRDQGRSTKEW